MTPPKLLHDHDHANRHHRYGQARRTHAHAGHHRGRRVADRLCHRVAAQAAGRLWPSTPVSPGSDAELPCLQWRLGDTRAAAHRVDRGGPDLRQGQRQQPCAVCRVRLAVGRAGRPVADIRPNLGLAQPDSLAARGPYPARPARPARPRVLDGDLVPGLPAGGARALCVHLARADRPGPGNVARARCGHRHVRCDRPVGRSGLRSRLAQPGRPLRGLVTPLRQPEPASPPTGSGLGPPFSIARRRRLRGGALLRGPEHADQAL